MALSVEKVGDVTVVALNVEQFDAGYADEFKREMTPVLKDTRKLVIDLEKVQFVDSRACGAILSCLKKLSEVGGELKICQATPFVRSEGFRNTVLSSRYMMSPRTSAKMETRANSTPTTNMTRAHPRDVIQAPLPALSFGIARWYHPRR